jgi:ankyrin repeat protein/transposase-like protein
MLATLAGKTAHVTALVAAGADVNFKNDHGRTALMIAATKGHADIVKALIAAGADVNAKGNLTSGSIRSVYKGEGASALTEAVRVGNLDCVNALIEAGSDVNAKVSRTADGGCVQGQPLTEAVRVGNLDCLKALIEAGADVDAKPEHGRTALMRAVLEDNLAALTLLIAAGADVNAEDQSGHTALLMETAAIWKPERRINADCVKALIAAGADVNATNRDGDTALILAATFGDAESVKALVAAGADVNAKNNDADTAFMTTTSAGVGDVLRAAGVLTTPSFTPLTAITVRFPFGAPCCRKSAVTITFDLDNKDSRGVYSYSAAFTCHDCGHTFHRLTGDAMQSSPDELRGVTWWRTRDSWYTQEGGTPCPHCGALNSLLRYNYNSSSDEDVSMLTCAACNWSIQSA